MACVATTPTPASAHSTPFPTEKTRDCTAPPTSPVAGSYPRMEKVPTGCHGSAPAPTDTVTAGRSCAAAAARGRRRSDTAASAR